MTPLAYLLADGDATFWLPKQASKMAVNTDWLFYAILYTSAFFFAIIVAAALFFIIKYRRRALNETTPLITHNTTLEVIWTGIPLLIVIGIFFVGLKGFIDLENPSSDAYVIQVTARQWNFEFTYPNGGTSDTLYVPYQKPVKLVLSSTDVLHAVYIPAFRIQRNAIPGRDTQIWFTATKHSPAPGNTPENPGGFSLFCTQYCGNDHSHMHTRVHVLDAEPFAKKLVELANPFKSKDPGSNKEHWIPYAQVGQKLSASNGCFQCHSVDGKAGTGPTWKDLFKSDHKFSFSDKPGYTLAKADDDAKWDAYFHESVLNPGAKIKDGFQNQMQSFASSFSGDPGTAKDEKLRAIIEYIKTLGPDYQGPTLFGKPVPQDNVTPEMYEIQPHQVYHPEALKSLEPAASAPATQDAK